MMLTWLADVLRAAGLPVIEVDGWRTRGHGGMVDVRGVLCHHMGTASSNGWQVVLNGRPDLAGPLAHLTLERDGTFRVIAAGQCWHAGLGGPLLDCPTDQGNAHLVGIEGVSDGASWTDAQRRNYVLGVAAILRHLGAKDAHGWVADHREWAPRRKDDRGAWDSNQFRADVTAALLHGAAPTPDHPQEDDMPGVDDVWNHQISTHWPGQPTRTDTAANILGFEDARHDATRKVILDAIAALSAKLDQLAAGGGGQTPKASSG